MTYSVLRQPILKKMTQRRNVMFELFMLASLLGIGLSQLLPEWQKKEDSETFRPGKKRSNMPARTRSDRGGETVKKGKRRSVSMSKFQALAARTLMKSSGATGLPK